MIAMSRFSPHTIGAHSFFAIGVIFLVLLLTQPRCVSETSFLGGGEDMPIMLLAAVAVTVASGVAEVWFWCYRRKIRHVFRVYVEDAHETDFQDIMGKFGLINCSGNPGSFLNGSSGFWVAEDGGEIVGFVGLDANVGEKGTAEVRRLVVSPYHHRRGVGTKLMDAVVQHAHMNGTVTLELITSDYNVGALSLYKKGGWQVRTKMRYAGIFLNVLRKDL
ncbi:acyl-CoA N-acyltransferase [Collybia nuda]|uniref:Acyl-CoA N-acyltransferase n=1 Tax=Collybia nuda TaxID=64659 RepID=A0A9P5Y223_9AGAR|nr:acyl-CoA N-acyltransferase [Collybia nuda]